MLGFALIAGMRTKPWPADRDAGMNRVGWGDLALFGIEDEGLFTLGLKMGEMSTMQIDLSITKGVGDDQFKQLVVCHDDFKGIG